MDKEIPLSKLVKMSQKELDAADPSCSFFFDWWCRDSSLPGKSRRLMSSVRAIVGTGTKAFDPDKTYVFFKNNCPCCGGLYDDLRICDIESGEVLFNVCPSKKTVYFEGHWEKGLKFGSMKELKTWFRDWTPGAKAA